MVSNLLPNTNWQLLTQIASVARAMNREGTGLQANTSVSSFTPNSNAPTFYTADTGQLYAGAIVQFPAGQGSLSVAPLRISRLDAGHSFTCVLPFGLSSPSKSFPTTALPTSASDTVGITGDGPDGWSKTASLLMWPDDFPVNACVGAVRVLGLRKGSGGPETLSWRCPPNDVRRYAGRTVIFGVLVYQKVMSGSGRWHLKVTDSTGKVSRSNDGAGSGYRDPVYGGYQFLYVAAIVAAGAVSVVIDLVLEGNVSDVYYVALPTLTFGVGLAATECGPNSQELIHAITHWNPPVLTPLEMTFPATIYPRSQGLYGYSGLDLEALSGGTCHHTVKAVKSKIELRCTTAGVSFLTGSAINPSSLTFGPQAMTQLANVRVAGAGWWPLDPDGCCMICVDRPSAVIYSVFDFDDVLV